MTLPTHALSIRQPWPSFIFHLPPEFCKDVENRDWDKPGAAARQAFRGWVWIHASTSMMKSEFEDGLAFARDEVGVPVELLPHHPGVCTLGAIVGAVEILDFVHEHPSYWFMGPGALVLGRRKELPTPVPAKGMLGFWRVPEDVMAQIRAVTARAA